MAQIERRKFGNTGIEVSVLGFGGAEIGFEGATPDQVAELLNGALDAGLNVIDTAECYANSEELIGEAVAGRRDEFTSSRSAGTRRVSARTGGARRSCAASSGA